MSTKETIDLVKEREKFHGPVVEGHRNLGLIFAGILSDHYQVPLEPLPADIVALLYASAKLSRAARPFEYRGDNYVDARVYTDLAQKMRLERIEIDLQRKDSVLRKAGDDESRIRRRSS